MTLFFIFTNSSLPLDKFVQIFLPNGKNITAELTMTDEERARGLMFRERVDDDQGMLFVFEDEGFYSFWMKNMKFPIDILWLDKEKRIVHIEHCVPPCRREPCLSYEPDIPSLYVLELKAGSVEKNTLKLYDKIDFILPSQFHN